METPIVYCSPQNDPYFLKIVSAESLALAGPDDVKLGTPLGGQWDLVNRLGFRV